VSSPNSILSEPSQRLVFAESIAAARRIFTPKPKLNIWQWAEQSRYLAKGVSAKTLEGSARYSTAPAPHQRKPQESPTDPTVQITVLVMASQVGGKTEIFNNVIGYHMDHCPRSAVIMYPTVEAAERYSKKKFTPMVEATPCLSAIVRPSRSRDSGNTILSKDFEGGSVYFVGANSPPSLRGTSGAVLLGDEVDSYSASAGEEGDPVELLWKRGESFPNCVKILASTPTIGGRDEKGTPFSPIWAWFELSDQQYWFVPCAKCGFYQALKWSQIQWPKDKPEKACIICEKCAAALDDRQRLDMYYAGDWRPTAPFNGIRGFHLNGIYTPWPAQKGYATRLEQMAREHVRATKKGEQAIRVWTNTFLCECFDQSTEKIDYVKLLERAETYTPDKLPVEIIIVLAAVDVQKDRVECETIGLGEDDQTWGVEHRKFFGDTEQDDVWDDLAQHLAKTYTRADGIILPITATAIDMRHKPQKVRDFVRQAGLPRIYPVYGINSSQQPILVTTRFNNHYRLRTFAVAGKIAKDTLFARLKIEKAGPRYMHFPSGHGYTEDYFSQLTAEVLRRRKVRGVVVENYEKIRDRNEALDIRVYQLACIDILKPNLTAIARRLQAAAPALPKDYVLNPPQSQPTEPGKKNPPPPGRRKIRVGKW
jgi:phage terminase large subunit GpA-like protein